MFVGLVLDAAVLVADTVVFGKMVLVPLMTVSVSIPTPPPAKYVMVLVEPLVAVVCMFVPFKAVVAPAEAVDCSVPIEA